MYVSGQPLVMLVAAANWALVAWSVNAVVRGKVAVGLLALAVWAPAFWVIASRAHRSGRVRLWVSSGSVVVVALLTAWLALSQF